MAGFGERVYCLQEAHSAEEERRQASSNTPGKDPLQLLF